MSEPLLRCLYRQCRFEVPVSEGPQYFYRDKNGPHGFRKICKACYSEAPCIVRRNAERAATKEARRRMEVR